MHEPRTDVLLTRRWRGVLLAASTVLVGLHTTDAGAVIEPVVQAQAGLPDFDSCSYRPW